MRVTALPQAPGSRAEEATASPRAEEALRRRARHGSARAGRRLARRHLERTSALAALVAPDAEKAARLAPVGFAIALQDTQPLPDALITAFAGLAVETDEPDLALGRLLLLLVDLEHREVEAAAPLLTLSTDEATILLDAARNTVGMSAGRRSCRGWGLVAGSSGPIMVTTMSTLTGPGSLSAAEREAGREHLRLCRRCRRKLHDREQAQAAVVKRTAGVAGLVVAADLAAAGVPAVVGLGGLFVGKAAVGLAGVVGGAVVAVAGSGVLAETDSPRPLPSPTTSPAPTTPAATDEAGQVTAAGTGTTTPSTTAARKAAAPRSSAPVKSAPGSGTVPLPKSSVGLPVDETTVTNTTKKVTDTTKTVTDTTKTVTDTTKTVTDTTKTVTDTTKTVTDVGETVTKPIASPLPSLPGPKLP